MKTLDFKLPSKIKYKYFFFGHCSEDAVSALIESAEDAGCEYMQVIMGMMPAPGSHLALPGTRPQMIPVVRVFVRCPASEYAKVVERVNAQAGQVTP